MMKKFLSSLLALTMILSLVIVPANAAVGDDKIEGVSMNTPTVTLEKYASQDVTFNYPAAPKAGDGVTVNGNKTWFYEDFNVKVYSDDMSVAMVSFTNGSSKVTIQSVGKEGTANIKYTVSFKAQNGSAPYLVTQTLTTKVTVKSDKPTDPETPEVTYDYSVGGKVTVTGNDTVASGTPITFTADTSAIKVYKTASTEGAQPEEVKTGVKFAYAWDGNAATNSNTYKTTYTTTKDSENKTAECVVTVSVDGTDFSQALTKASKTISVTNQNAAAQAAFEEAVTKAGFTYKTRATSLDKTNRVVTYKPYVGETASYSDFALASAITGFGTITIAKNGDNGFTVSGTKDSSPVSMDFTFKASTAPSVTFTNSLTSGEGFTATVQKDGTITVTAKASNVTNPSYEWVIGKKTVGTEAGFTFNKENKYTATKGTVTAVCKVHENGGSAVAAQATFTLTVSDEACTLEVKPEKLTFAQTGSSNYQTLTATLYKTENNQQKEVTTGVTYSFKASDDSVIGFSKSSNPARVYLKKQDNATITVTATFEGKTYTETVEVKGTLLNASLDKVENGGNLEFDYNDLEKAANEALPGRVTVNDDKPITLSDIPTRDSDGGMIYDGNHKVTGNCSIDDDDDDLEFRAANGFVGDAKMTMTVTGDDGKTYVIALAIPVTMREAKFDDQVTGGESSYKVSVPDGYKAYSVLGVNKAPDSDKYNKTWTIRNAEYSGSSLYSVKSTDLKDGEVKLYIVAIDSDGKAYAGTLTVTANSYSIKYNVVAGESVTFDQKRFESFMEDYADDNIKTSKGDYFKFDYVKFTSLPNSTREGVLYEGKDKIKTSTEVEDLDKVTFESVAKAKDTIKVPFTLYAKQYDKNDKVIDKKVSMTGEVVISVVKEDIVFEVGVNSAVKLGSDKFIDFLRDSDKSYKKADLDYVTFDVGKNSAITSYFNGTGALYRYYNGSTGVNSTVSAKDEFYYNPKTSSKHYDLDDVAYVTSKFAKVGDIVYIPFTAYGTKSGQKAEGTIAIKVKQTMSFVDVHTYDYFYDSVQWAVNLDITKGTSATTFSPKQGCTRAQIVTFLWRAANSPAPRSSTNKFTDVYATTHADYMKAIIWATEQGITTGTGNGKFSPDATCTRAQIVTFLYRFKNNPAVYGSLNFSDVNKTEHAAFYNAILWAVNNKITTGYGNGIFDPNGTCNRGDAVTFLYRALA